MTNLDSDLIRRGDVLEQIRDAYKRTYTAARRQGYKAAMEIVTAVPARRQGRFRPGDKILPALRLPHG